MSEILKKITKVHDAVHVFDVKNIRKYSEPKIYIGGIDIRNRNKLSKKVQEKSLKKQWYVYFRYRNPETGKLEIRYY